MLKGVNISKLAINRMVTYNNPAKESIKQNRHRRNTHNLHETKNKPHDIIAAYSPMRLINESVLNQK